MRTIGEPSMLFTWIFSELIILNLPFGWYKFSEAREWKKWKKPFVCVTMYVARVSYSCSSRQYLDKKLVLKFAHANLHRYPFVPLFFQFRSFFLSYSLIERVVFSYLLPQDACISIVLVRNMRQFVFPIHSIISRRRNRIKVISGRMKSVSLFLLSLAISSWFIDWKYIIN